MHIAVMLGTVSNGKKMSLMTDKQMTELIEVLQDIFEDNLEEGIPPVSVASVMLAVAVKKLQKTLDAREFTAIMMDLTQNQFGEWEQLTDQELEDLLAELDEEIMTKRILH